MMGLTPGNLHNSCSETLSDARLPSRSASSGSTSFCCGFVELILTRLPFESNGVQIQAIRDMIVADMPVRSIDKKLTSIYPDFVNVFWKLYFVVPNMRRQICQLKRFNDHEAKAVDATAPICCEVVNHPALLLPWPLSNKSPYPYQIYFVKKLCNTCCKNPLMYLLDTTSL